MREDTQKSVKLLIGLNLRRLRLANNLTQKEIGELIGLRQASYCLIEQGRVDVPASRIVEFACLYAVPVDDILGYY